MATLVETREAYGVGSRELRESWHRGVSCIILATLVAGASGFVLVVT